MKQVFPRLERPTNPLLDLEFKHSVISSADSSSTLLISLYPLGRDSLASVFLVLASYFYWKIQSLSFWSSTTKISSFAMDISSTFSSSSRIPSYATYVKFFHFFVSSSISSTLLLLAFQILTLLITVVLSPLSYKT
jgi:hypothetical protein